MDKEQFFEMIYTREDPKDEWYAFYKTRDWYDMPEHKDENDRIYHRVDAIQRNPYRETAKRFYIYPKDIQFLYDYTPDMARGFLNAVRDSLGLSVSGPITVDDLQTYTQLDLQTILGFILES